MNNGAGGGPDANGPPGTEYTLQGESLESLFSDHCSVPTRVRTAHFALAGVMRFLQLEWHRYERERNAWDIERAEMKAKIAKQEGEARSSKKLNDQLNRQIRMLEKALKDRANKSASSDGNEANQTDQEKEAKAKSAETTEAGRAAKATKRAYFFTRAPLCSKVVHSLANVE